MRRTPCALPRFGLVEIGDTSSVPGLHAAVIVDTIPVWLHSELPDRAGWRGGCLLLVEHRVIDNGPTASVMRALEATLIGPVLDKLRALAGAKCYLYCLWTHVDSVASGKQDFIRTGPRPPIAVLEASRSPFIPPTALSAHCRECLRRGCVLSNLNRTDAAPCESRSVSGPCRSRYAARRLRRQGGTGEADNLRQQPARALLRQG